MLVALPIALLTLIRPLGRLAFFGLGLLFMVVTDLTLPPSGPDNPMLLIPVLGGILAVDAVVAELISRLIGLIRSLRRE